MPLGSIRAARTSLGVDPATKKPRKKWHCGFETRREAEAFRATLAHHPAFSAGMGVYGTTRLRTGDYLDQWLESHPGTRRGPLEEKTKTRYRQLIHVHLKPHLGHIPLPRLSPHTIQECYSALERKPISRSTVHYAAAVLHKALEDAMKRGLIIRNPADQTQPPACERKPTSVLSPNQLHAYLEDARQTAPICLWALYVTKAGTGMRLGELLGLPESDLDLENGTLAVRQTLKEPGRKARFGNPKTERSKRIITLPAGVVDVLRQLRRWKLEQRFSMGPKFTDYGLVFCSPKGRPLHANNIRRRDHYPRLKRLHLPYVRLHDLRHGHGTYLAVAGVDARTIADRLGHSSPAFTMSTYVHGTTEAQRHAAEVATKLLPNPGRFSGTR